MAVHLNTIRLAVHRDAVSDAARAAMSLAGEAGATLHLVHVGRVAPPEPWPDRDTDPFFFQELFDEAGRAIVAEALRQVAQLGGCAVRGHFLTGDPVGAILGLCGKMRVDLLVLGGTRPRTMRRWPRDGALLDLVQRAICPVLVVPPRAWPPTRIALADDGWAQPWRVAGLAVRIGRLCGADTGAILARRVPYPEPAESRDAARPGAATPADARSPVVARPPATTLVAITQQRARNDLRRWTRAGWSSPLDTGPTLIVPA